MHSPDPFDRRERSITNEFDRFLQEMHEEHEVMTGELLYIVLDIMVRMRTQLTREDTENALDRAMWLCEQAFDNDQVEFLDPEGEAIRIFTREELDANPGLEELEEFRQYGEIPDFIPENFR